MKLGDCYEVHGKAIAFNEEEGLLCHGTVYHSVAGWHGHAWIEDGDMVLDLANGKKTILPIEVYYALGKVKDVKRYTAEEARKMMLDTGHFGSW